MSISMTTRVSVSPEVLLQEVGGEAVLLDLQSECYFGLDEVGTRIWRLIETNGELGNVHLTLLAEYDVEPSRLESDISDLVSRLLDAGLISIEPTHAAQA